MKKLILISALFIFSIIFSASAKADIVPLSISGIKNYGIGVINMPKTFKVYQYPYADAKVIKEIVYDGVKRSAIVNSDDARKNAYVVFVPSENIALLTVDNVSENGWYCVYIDKTGTTGWIKEDDESAFMTYKNLFYKYGKKYGIRMFSDLPESEKVLYSQDNKKSQVLARLTYPKTIAFTVIKGNWMLVSVSEFNEHEKIGWFNWRNDDGTLNVFPLFKY